MCVSYNIGKNVGPILWKNQLYCLMANNSNYPNQLKYKLFFMLIKAVKYIIMIIDNI